jgi:YspA, cpYpsA-related SLOG family
MKIVLVCGGRDYSDKECVFATLTYLHWRRGPIAVILHGDAPGADSLGAEWARATDGVRDLPFPAKWTDLDHPDALIKTRRDGTQYDARAGFRRNQAMLDRGKPDFVVAFPGGTGTADMVRRAKAANVEVIDAR